MLCGDWGAVLLLLLLLLLVVRSSLLNSSDMIVSKVYSFAIMFVLDLFYLCVCRVVNGQRRGMNSLF